MVTATFYENYRTIEEMRITIEAAEEALPMLEALQRDQSSAVHHLLEYTQRRRLMALTGNGDLQIGDTSPAGFSLKHTPQDAGNNAASAE